MAACRDVTNTLMKNASSNAQSHPISKMGQRQEALQAAFPIAYDTTTTYDDDNIDEKTDKTSGRHLAYPGVKYWTKDRYKQSDADANSSESFPKKLRFLEDEDGNLIPQDLLDEMRSHLLQAFEEIRASMPSLLEGSWLKCNPELIKMCYKEMRRLFPELTLCAQNWKARKLLVVWYSNYSKNRKNLGKPGPRDDEFDISEDDETDAAAIPAKRKNMKKENNARKKVKQNAEPDITRDEDNSSEIPERTREPILEGAKCKVFQLKDPLASPTSDMSSRSDQRARASSAVSSMSAASKISSSTSSKSDQRARASSTVSSTLTSSNKNSNATSYHHSFIFIYANY